MRIRDEISSTEELIDLIQSNDSVVDGSPNNIPPPGYTKTKKRPFARKWSLKSTKTIGIDIGHKDLKLIMIKEPSDQQWKLQGYMTVPFDPTTPNDSPKFTDFLKTSLVNFCGSPGKYDLWALIPSELANILYLKIPKVTKRQIDNAAYWSFKKEVSLDQKEDVFDFEALEEIIEEGAKKTPIIAYSSSNQEINQLKTLFSKSGFPLTGITVAPFAIQNLFRTHLIKTSEKAVGNLYIGEGWSRIDIFSSGNLVLSRNFKAGINSMIEDIIEDINETQERISISSAEKENTQGHETPRVETHINNEQARKILFSLCPDSPPLTKTDAGYYLKQEDIFKKIIPALERLTKQIERSFEHYSSNLGQDSVSRIYIMGELSSYNRLVKFISDQTGVPANVIDPMPPGISFSKDVSIPHSLPERSSFTTAVGLALSHKSRTPNLVFTYKDKVKQAAITRINRAIFVVFILLIFIFMGIFLWQGHTLKEKKSKKIALQQELEKYNPRINQALLLQLAAKATHKRHIFNEYSNRYLGMAVIEELSRITPPNIRLLNATINLGKTSESKKKNATKTLNKKNGDTKTLSLEGLIFGEPQILDSDLAIYLIRLERSPVFSQPSIHKKTLEPHEGKNILHFTVHLTIICAQNGTTKNKKATSS